MIKIFDKKSFNYFAITCIIILKYSTAIFTDEGMWLPFLLENKYQEMKARGLALTKEDLFSMNNACIATSIVKLNDGSASAISGKGLLLTNRHVIFSQIQSLTSSTRNIIDNGFWANKMEEEVYVPNSSALFLIRVEGIDYSK